MDTWIRYTYDICDSLKDRPCIVSSLHYLHFAWPMQTSPVLRWRVSAKSVLRRQSYRWLQSLDEIVLFGREADLPLQSWITPLARDFCSCHLACLCDHSRSQRTWINSSVDVEAHLDVHSYLVRAHDSPFSYGFSMVFLWLCLPRPPEFSYVHTQ